MTFKPDFDGECYVCGCSPTVIVEGHIQPKTDLCGPHFFHDWDMADYEEWNNQTEEDSDD